MLEIPFFLGFSNLVGFYSLCFQVQVLARANILTSLSELGSFKFMGLLKALAQ